MSRTAFAIAAGENESLLWNAVDGLLDRMGPSRAAAQGLGPLAARRLRMQGASLPDRLFRELRAAATANLVAPSLLSRVRAAYDGRLLLLKGPELAQRYPDKARRFGDIDLLVEDADAAQSALLGAGFRLHEEEWPPPGWTYVGRRPFHLQPLEWPGLALRLEIHNHVNWPPLLEPPPVDELFDAAIASSVGIDGILAPHPHHHAILLAAHTWSEGPLHRVRDLIDVMTFVPDTQRNELQDAAERWGFERPWAATLDAADWLIFGAAEPRLVRLCARYLRDFEEPSVVEMHIQRWFSPFWLEPLGPASRHALAALVRDFRPWPNQTWKEKARQTMRALLHPSSSKSAHDQRSTAPGKERERRGSGIASAGRGSTYDDHR